MYRIQVRAYIDGKCIGYVTTLCPENGVKFSYLRSKIGCYKMKFKEASVDEEVEDFAVLKANASKQWDSKVGTITVKWNLYSEGDTIGVSELSTAGAPPMDQAVGNTLKFWQRPSAAVEIGQELPGGSRTFYKYAKTYFPGDQYKGTCTVWYHAPAVFAVFQNLAATAAAAAAAAPANNLAGDLQQDAEDDDDEDAVVEVAVAAGAGAGSGASKRKSSAEVVDLTTLSGYGRRIGYNEVVDLMVDSDGEGQGRQRKGKAGKRARLAGKKALVKKEVPSSVEA